MKFIEVTGTLTLPDFAQGRNSTGYNIGVEETPSYTR